MRRNLSDQLLSEEEDIEQQRNWNGTALSRDILAILYEHQFTCKLALNGATEFCLQQCSSLFDIFWHIGVTQIKLRSRFPRLMCWQLFYGIVRVVKWVNVF